MANLNLVTPSNLGETIIKDSLDENKWNVVIDPNYFTVTDNGIVLADVVLKPLKDKAIVSGIITSNNVLELNHKDGSKLFINLSAFAPAVVADNYLRRVEYDNTTKELIFTVGSDTKIIGTYRVTVADLVTVASGTGLEGTGTTADPVRIKSASDKIIVTSDGVTLNLDGTVELVDAFDDVHLGWFFPQTKPTLDLPPSPTPSPAPPVNKEEDKYRDAPTRDFKFTYPKLKGSDSLAASEYFGGSIGALEMEVRDSSGYVLPDYSTVEIPTKGKLWVVYQGKIVIWDKDRPAHDEEWGPVYVNTTEDHAVFGKHITYRSNQNIHIPMLGSADPIPADPNKPNVTVPRSQLRYDFYGNVIATLHSITTDLYLHYTPKGKSEPRVMHIYAPDHEWEYALLDDEVGYIPYRLYSHAEIGGAIDNFVFDRTMFEPNTEIYFTTKNINKDGLESNHITFPNVNYEKSAKYFILEPDTTVTPNRVLVYATWGEHGAAPKGTNVRIVAGDNVTTFNYTLDENGYFYPTNEVMSVLRTDWKHKAFISNYGGDETSLQLIEVRKEV